MNDKRELLPDVVGSTKHLQLQLNNLTMAKEKIALGINLRQNKITGNAGYGKYYPEVDVQKTLSLRGFAKHMTDHGCVFGRDVLEAVLIKITECLPELVSQGIPV